MSAARLSVVHTPHWDRFPDRAPWWQLPQRGVLLGALTVERKWLSATAPTMKAARAGLREILELAEGALGFTVTGDWRADVKGPGRVFYRLGQVARITELDLCRVAEPIVATYLQRLPRPPMKRSYTMQLVLDDEGRDLGVFAENLLPW